MRRARHSLHAAAIASLIPVVRAARIEPVRILREE